MVSPAASSNAILLAFRPNNCRQSGSHSATRRSRPGNGIGIPGPLHSNFRLLYLVIDQQDRRPLIIDQPNENLDPKSAFDELRPHFRGARKRRRVIIVTAC